ncbi:peptide chain release factor N(5)-glutamine methyltransferase [Saccharobesus litoralis]|uniref:Release factor glutamine methyltransferase n=1 Tax=Saccharobesus litoralis TaxID=2172099 RepID=A0A2S0VU15_9ALTE|nr:peptide chain release factor N(5)-glutamine methyltransferase [Saccharobesus litoralis]AWB67699.1 peptide chain release factor N(5)-glutamine methyltransferase [Saccharobesus litoralis]
MSLTINEAVNWAASLFIGSDSAKLDAELLLLNALGKDNRTYLYTWPDRYLSQAQKEKYDHLVELRKNGVPVAHILGVREFWGLELNVNDKTLIPRPDTETLVEAALNLIDQEQMEPCRLLDLGTGTGAIALALASELPNWQIWASDKIEQAVKLAKDNAKKLDLDIQVAMGDWFSPFESSSEFASAFSLIVSNPPYIAKNDSHLTQGDVRFEPLSALVADNDGLKDLDFLIDNSRRFLRQQGWLILEHGYEQGEQVRHLFEKYQYKQIKTLRDLGQQERITLAQFVA